MRQINGSPGGIMKNILILLVAFSISAFAQSFPNALAQQSQKDGQAVLLSTITCQSIFLSGSGNSYLNFCVTQNGNISTLESPQTFSQIYLGAEGYGICDTTTGKVGYNDWGRYGDSGNWLDPSIVQPNGVNTFPLTITRTTSDGVWSLKQVFSRNTTTPSVKVTMTLRNNSAVPRVVYLERFADVDADGAPGSNRFDGDKNASWGHLDHGVMLRAASGTHNMSGFVVPALAQDPCALTPQSLPFIGDGAAMYDWEFNPIGAQSSQSVIIEYRPF